MLMGLLPLVFQPVVYHHTKDAQQHLQREKLPVGGGHEEAVDPRAGLQTSQAPLSRHVLTMCALPTVSAGEAVFQGRSLKGAVSWRPSGQHTGLNPVKASI